jgi:branched-subunit amino acid ABC-type transport system permease component
MEKLFQAIYGGLLSGSVYGLMALGLTLIWGSLRMLNLAHGSLYLVGGYVIWTVLNQLKLPVLPAFVIGVLGAGLVGFLIQVLLLNPIVGKPGWDNASLIATVGASIIIESAVLIIYGARVKQMPAAIKGQFKLLDVVISYQGLLIIGVALLSLILMSLFLRNSRYGMAIRAVSQQMDAARLMGIPTRNVFIIVMVISAALAGLAGALLSSIFFLTPNAGFNPMVKSLVVTIFGGLGSVKGTIWAAYLIGLLEAFLQVYMGASWALPGLFLFMIVMLIVRPNGLFGLGEMQRL